MEMRGEGGALAGPGAGFLLAEGRRAGFFLLGEDHGVAEVPQVASALFGALSREGYRHLAVEVSPLMARTLEDVARAGGRDTIFNHARMVMRHPLEVPFYSWREEGRLLHDAVRAAPPTRAGVIWGVDQEFVASSPTVMRWLQARARDDRARAVAAEFRARADSGVARGFAGRPEQMLVLSADSGDYARLRQAFAADSEAVDVIGQMEASGRIYSLMFGGQGDASNQVREELMKRNLARWLRRADQVDGDAGKVMMKFGGAHLSRGQKVITDDFSLGNFVSELATWRGTTSFHVLVVGGRGSRVATASPRGFATGASLGDEAWMAPVVAQALPAGWTVFDLRPLRPALSAGRFRVEEELRRVIFGYDALVVLTGSTPAGAS
jgi:hypothetical protein